MHRLHRKKKKICIPNVPYISKRNMIMNKLIKWDNIQLCIHYLWRKRIVKEDKPLHYHHHHQRHDPNQSTCTQWTTLLNALTIFSHNFHIIWGIIIIIEAYLLLTTPRAFFHRPLAILHSSNHLFGSRNPILAPISCIFVYEIVYSYTM